jgi:hypothetical protein
MQEEIGSCDIFPLLNLHGHRKYFPSFHRALVNDNFRKRSDSAMFSLTDHHVEHHEIGMLCIEGTPLAKAGTPCIAGSVVSDPASKKLPSITAPTRTRGVQKRTSILDIGAFLREGTVRIRKMGYISF